MPRTTFIEILWNTRIVKAYNYFSIHREFYRNGGMYMRHGPENLVDCETLTRAFASQDTE